jgi:alpha-tubulin suppressor-like RCC1 family protein
LSLGVGLLLLLLPFWTQSQTTYYTDGTSGNNGYDGLSNLVVNGHGPKFDVTSAIAVASNGDAIVAAATVYHELLWNLAAKNLTLDPQGQVTVTIATDSVGDGIPDWWRQQYFGGDGTTTDSTSCASCDPDGDGLTNLQEYQAGRDPNDYYNGMLPILQVVSGNGQGGLTNQFLAQPLVVSVTNAIHGVLTNAPVTFAVQGSGLLAASINASPTNSLTMRTDINGQAAAYFLLPSTFGTTNQITATVTTGTNSTQVVFTAWTCSSASACINGLVCWWPFDEGRGTITMDASGNGSTGVLTNGAYASTNDPTWITGILSNALSFDGYSNQYVQAQPTGTVTGTFTVAAWVLLPDRDDYFCDGMCVFSTTTTNTDGDSETIFDLLVTPGSNIVWDISDGVNSTGGSANFNYTTGTWYHIACVVTPTNCAVYVNGVVTGGGSSTAGPPLLYDGGEVVAIGMDPVSGDSFNGSIDDVRVYDQALAANEVAALYDVDTIGDGIPNWWRQQYFGSGSTTNSDSCASCDPDGDGFTNLDDYLAGRDPWHPPSPSFTPEGGAYLTPISVTVSSIIAGATIHYTTNGLVPTTTDLVIASGGTVMVSAPTLLRAAAFKSGMTNSETKSGLYQIGARVAAGWDYSFALETDGTLWAWGWNDHGQLGDGMVKEYEPGLGWDVDRWLPAQVSGISNVWAVAGGQWHTVAADTNGTVWTWGSNVDGSANGNGELGDGTYTNHYTPLAISGVSNVIAVAAGASHSMALRSDGTVWTWGDNGSGKLGIGSSGGNTNVPVQAVGLTQMIGITAGAYHSVALRADGTVWTWGDNGSGKLGIGSSVGNTNWPVQAVGLTQMIAVAAGTGHSVALRADGTVWTWGDNGSGQLGRTNDDNTVPDQVSGLSNVVAIAAGQLHTLAVTADGHLYAWGDNEYGQLGVGNNNLQSTNTPQLVSTLTNAVFVSAGNHSLAVNLYEGVGILWAWGLNANGQIGDDTTTDRYYPVLVHTPFDAYHIGIPDWVECQNGWDLHNPDQNGDGLLDGISLMLGISPTNMDVDPFNPGSSPPQPPPPTNNHTPPVITLVEPADAGLQ